METENFRGRVEDISIKTKKDGGEFIKLKVDNKTFNMFDFKEEDKQFLKSMLGKEIDIKYSVSNYTTSDGTPVQSKILQSYKKPEQASKVGTTQQPIVTGKSLDVATANNGSDIGSAINRQSAVKSVSRIYQGKGGEVDITEIKGLIETFTNFIEKGEWN